MQLSISVNIYMVSIWDTVTTFDPERSLFSKMSQYNAENDKVVYKVRKLMRHLESVGYGPRERYGYNLKGTWIYEY